MPQANPERRADEVLTAEQVAELLKVHPNTVRRMAAAHELPGRKVGRVWRFRRLAILPWLDLGAQPDMEADPAE